MRIRSSKHCVINHPQSGKLFNPRSSDEKVKFQKMLRKATPDDVEGIRQLIDDNIDKLLPRSNEELRELINWFWVVEDNGIAGCCCLEVYSPKIAELRSLAVRHDCRGKGYG